MRNQQLSQQPTSSFLWYTARWSSRGYTVRGILQAAHLSLFEQVWWLHGLGPVEDYWHEGQQNFLKGNPFKEERVKDSRLIKRLNHGEKEGVIVNLLLCALLRLTFFFIGLSQNKTESSLPVSYNSPPPALQPYLLSSFFLIQGSTLSSHFQSCSCPLLTPATNQWLSTRRLVQVARLFFFPRRLERTTDRGFIWKTGEPRKKGGDSRISDWGNSQNISLSFFLFT